MEHLTRFTSQYREAAENDYLILRLFPSSLTKTTFSWYVHLALNSIPDWEAMKNQFHNHFTRIDPGITISHLTRIQKRTGKPVDEYLTRFKNAKIRCDLNLPEGEFKLIAQDGLVIPFRKHFNDIIFRNFIELTESVNKYEQVLSEESQQQHRAFNCVTIEVEDELCEANLAEIPKEPPFQCAPLENKEIYTSRDMKNTKKRPYTFDITKGEEIFRHLHVNNIIKIKGNHKIPSAQGLKGKFFCLWYNARSLATDNYFVFRNILQDLIDNGQILFSSGDIVKTDDDPFSVLKFKCNMFDVHSTLTIPNCD
ncbi:uncharacterized protein LOC141640016 [Silene latifolia]|uniref:uncharacterized protein LOC141640016 n=1 Tax=Silene latifolia TaxID=37657 RepID=UPI003D76BC4B